MFRSARRTERHIWIDTYLDAELAIDVEDWDRDATWDNSVVYLQAPDSNLPGVVQAWLTVATVEECVRVGESSRSERLDP